MNLKNHIKLRKEGKTMRFARELIEGLKSNFSTFQLFNFSTRSARACAFVAAVAATTAQAALIEETMTLAKGWNAVYIESTPDESACEDFFRDTPVIAAAAYQSGADAATAQYDASNNEIVQAPIVFLQWSRGEKDSALQSIVGGGAYLVFATNATTISFTGVPAAPKMTWRKVSSSETNEFFNLVGVSSASAEVSIQDYFGEGPFGLTKAGRAIYAIGGDNPQSPDMRNAEQASFGRLTPIQSGKAYALTSTDSGEWPGIIGVQGNGVIFGANDNYASITVRNCGTTNHTFRFSVAPSASGEELPPISRRLPRVDAFSARQFTNVAESAEWTVSLDPDGDTVQMFSIDRSKLEAGKEYGAILVIEDLGPGKMRVRVPITVVQAPESDEAKFPVGLWSGYIELEAVSRHDDTNQIPVKAGGTMKMNVLMHVAPDGSVKLLQRVAAGVDTNGTQRLFKELESVPAEVQNARRFSTVMMSVDNPIVVANAGGEFGKGLAFDWTIGERASDNPFRHAWHPDHDGKKADYSGFAPSGDNLANYANPVKPELWSITNRMEFSWHENNDPNKASIFEWTPSEKTAGFVTWTVSGLTAKQPIVSLGVFVLQRAIKAAEVE